MEVQSTKMQMALCRMRITIYRLIESHFISNTKRVSAMFVHLSPHWPNTLTVKISISLNDCCSTIINGIISNETADCFVVVVVVAAVAVVAAEGADMQLTPLGIQDV